MDESTKKKKKRKRKKKKKKEEEKVKEVTPGFLTKIGSYGYYIQVDLQLSLVQNPGCSHLERESCLECCNLGSPPIAYHRLPHDFAAALSIKLFNHRKLEKYEHLPIQYSILKISRQEITATETLYGNTLCLHSEPW